MKTTRLFTLFISVFLINYSFSQGWQEIAETLPIPVAGADDQFFGESVDIEGDYAVVGARGTENFKGLAYVLYYDGSNWNNIAKLQPSDPAVDNYFGFSVGISGDDIVVGSYGDDDNGLNSGSIYIYTKPVGGWTDMTETVKLTPSDAASGDWFGYSVGISGNDVVASAYFDDDNGNNSGSIYVFTKPGATWSVISETAKLKPSDGFDNDYFGRTLTIDGNIIVAGAIGDDVNGSGSGSAYLFEKPGAAWINVTETAKFLASDGAAGDSFGSWVCNNGDDVIVGASGDDDAGAGSGSAYVFTKPGASWINMTETQKITAFDATMGDGFGSTVTIYGDDIAVGSPNKDAAGSQVGAVYTFERVAGIWNSTGKLTASDGAQQDYFGRGLELWNGRLLIGASGDDDNGLSSGSIYYFEEPGTGWVSATETQKIPSSYTTNLSNVYGSTVAVDGNYAVIGAPGSISGTGIAYVYFFDGANWINQAILTGSDVGTTEQFGYSVDISGDNIVIGARSETQNGVNSGSAYVFTKPGAAWVNMTETAKLTASDGTVGDYFGHSVAIDADVIVVGAYQCDIGGGNTGAAYVFEKPGASWITMTETAKLTTTVVQDGRFLGCSVDISGDDIVCGAYGDDVNGNESGALYIYTKPGASWINMTETAVLTASDGAASDQLGFDVAISGINIVSGAHLDDDGFSSSGSAYVFTKPGASWINSTETAKFNSSDASTQDNFGWSVAINGNDIFIGARYDDDNGPNSGSVYYFKMPGGGWVSAYETGKLLASDGGSLDYFGQSVDVSGEYFFGGASGHSDNGANSGAVYIFKRCPETTNTMNESACGSYTSPSGNYTWTVSNTYMDTIPNACGGDSVLTINLTINPLDDATFSYTGTDYCINNSNETPTVTGLGGGTFSSTPAGLSINASTGEINFGLSSGGNYTITYTTAGPCPNSSDYILTIYDTDTDGDGLADYCDLDDDNDGVLDAEDFDPLDPSTCEDIDGDGCDDCSATASNDFTPGANNDPINDGIDTDGDGICDFGDVDDDNDGVLDWVDMDPLNPYVCEDADGDGCDDCSVGNDGYGPAADNNPSNDGADTDGDGLCDSGDPDDDNDGVLDVIDNDPLNPFICEDADGDGCDDCSVGTDGYGPMADNLPANDGLDTDGDGICDTGDTDDDNDGCLDIDDANPTIASVDTDGDGIADDCDICPNDPWNDADGDGYCGDVDCNDFDAQINPGATEILCNGIDDDCNPATPDSEDADGDGVTTCAGDCDDNDPNNFPGNVEICDGQDNDCDGLVDANDPTVVGLTTYYADQDGDGYGDANVTVQDCSIPMGYVVDNTDCDDTDAQVNPGMTEVTCDGIDNDCNPATSDTPDNDGDGYSICAGDCNDGDAQINPGMVEVTCDGIDNDCNPATEDSPDADGDGYTVCAGDCDDNDNQVNPGMTEVTCDGIDNDCNPATEDAPDADGDGYTLCAGDCNDSDDQINPGMAEYGCDGIDNDCNPSTSDNIVVDVSTTSSGVLIVANYPTATSYQWIDCGNGNQPVTGATSQTFLASVGGEYAVIVTIDGCSDTSACVFVSDAGVDEFTKGLIAFYPNPTNGELNITFEGILIDFEVIDMLGRYIDVPGDIENGKIDLTALEPGDYLITVVTEAGLIIQQKISVVK